MDRVINLTAIVQREVEDYARGETWKAITYPILDSSRQTYAVLVVPEYPRKSRAGIVVAARVVDNHIIVDEDITDKPLWQELVRAGIPREQIILAYAGEKIPEST